MPQNWDATAKVVREALSRSEGRNAPDPAFQTPGAPPNYGQFILPHVMTLQGLATTVSRVYRASDEALRHSYENARFMRNDVGIMECVEARQRSTALLGWHLEPEDKKSQEQKDLCEQLTNILNRLPHFTQWRETLLHAVWYGRYAIQHRYQWSAVGDKMRVVPTAWKPINGDKLVFRMDGGEFDENQIGIRVGAAYQAGDRIGGRWEVEPTDRGMAYFLRPHERNMLAVHRHQIEDGAYESPEEAGKLHGVGVRSKIYWDWFQKQELLGFLMEFLERSAFGIEFWYYPWGNAQAEEKTRAAAQERIGNGRNVVLVPRPQGDDSNAYGVERLEPGLGGAEAIQSLLDRYYGHRIKRYILGQTLTSEADATGLGSGLAELHLGTYLDIIKYDATNAQETITDDLVEPIKRWNFPLQSGTRIKFVIETESQDMEKKLEGYRKAWEMGAKIKEQDVMEMIGAALATDQDRVLQSPQSIALEKYQDAMHPEEKMGDSVRKTLEHPEGLPMVDNVQPGHAKQITDGIDQYSRGRGVRPLSEMIPIWNGRRRK